MTDLIPRLGVNIDHVATLRQLRGTPYPSLIEAAQTVVESGADQITVHLREDRRHIQDRDVRDLTKQFNVPLNLEMSIAPEIVRIAGRTRPKWVCLVPERRQEVTTEGGLDLEKKRRTLSKVIDQMKRKQIQVSLFVEPTRKAVGLSHELGADAVELHTGRYCLATQTSKPNRKRIATELERISKAGRRARELGLGVHAGHGLDYENIRPLIELLDEDGRVLFEEVNIGHSIVCRAAMVGLARAVREMAAQVKSP